MNSWARVFYESYAKETCAENCAGVKIKFVLLPKGNEAFNGINILSTV